MRRLAPSRWFFHWEFLSMMMSLKALVLLGATATVASQPPAGAPLLIDSATLRAAGLTPYWQAQLPLGAEDTIKEGHLVDEALYVISDGGSVFSLKTDAGLLRWSAKLTERDYVIYRPTHLDCLSADRTGPVVIPTTTETFVYDRYSGNLLQSFVPRFPVGGSAVGYDSTVFMGGSDGRFYSLLLADPRIVRPYLRWEVLAGGPVTASPLLYGNRKLLFASQNGVVFSCSAIDKTFGWAFATGGAILGNPVVDASGVYVASFDRSLYKLHTGVGEMLWRVRFPNPLVEGPVVQAHTVYQYCRDYGVTAIDADTGEERWHVATARFFAARSRDRTILFTHDRRLLVVDQDSGEIEGSIPAAPAFTVVSNPHDDAVYLLDRAGRVLCARAESIPYLRIQQVIAARQQLNLQPLQRTRLEGPSWEADEADPSLSDPLRSRRDLGR